MPSSAPRPSRLLSLDVVRGIALCGILFANVATVLGVHVMWGTDTPPVTYTVENLLFHQRFFPIFSLLFGIGFGMLHASAERRVAHPRLVLARRLLVLVALGAVHQLFHPGEALLVYGVAGLVLLLPATLIPERARPMLSMLIGIVLLVPGAAMGGIALVPGLFLLGFGAAQLGLPRRFEESARPGAVLAVVAGAVAVPLTWMQLQNAASAGFDTTSVVAGLATGMCLVGCVTVLLRTPLRAVLAGVFAPLGRMALTNYVGATAVITLVGFSFAAPALLRSPSVEITEGSLVMIWGACVVLLLLQTLVSLLWLRRFGQGPLEKAWRWLTWTGARPLA